MSERAQAVTHIAAIDGLRGVAITLVLLVHCVRLPASGTPAWVLRHTLSNGWIGVDLFFALSGYLITAILLRTKHDPHYFRNFYARRTLRIFPLYYGIIGALWLLGPALGFARPQHLSPYLLYLSNFTAIAGRPEWVPLGHAWSLAIEEQFYLVFPFVVWIFNRRSLRFALWTIVVLSPLIRILTNAAAYPGASYFLTFCRLDGLAMGGLIALTLEGRGEVSEQRSRLLKVLLWVFSGLTVLLWLSRNLDFKKTLFNAVGLTVVDATCALLLLFVIIRPESPPSRLLSTRLPAALGRISYCIYLVHLPVLLFVDRYSLQTFGESWVRTAITAAVSISITIATAIISWHVVEQPLLRLKRRFDGVVVLPVLPMPDANASTRRSADHGQGDLLP